MKRKIGFYLAEFGIERDFEITSLSEIHEKLETDKRLIFSSESKREKNKGFYESKIYKDDKFLISKYCRETTQPTKTALVSTSEGIERISLGRGEEISLVKRSYYILWQDLRICAFLDLPLDVAESLSSELASILFRYASGQGYSLYSISDEAMAKLKELGKAHSEELELRGVLRLGLRSIGKRSLDRHINRIQYVGENGESSQIEKSRDRFTELGINLCLGQNTNEDDEQPPKISSAKQHSGATKFTLEGNLPSDEELDDFDTVKELAGIIKKYVAFFSANGIIESELLKNPSLTKYRIRTLGDFEGQK